MSDQVPAEWFEMSALRRRRFASSVWVPLRASETRVSPDGREEIFAAGSAAFPEEARSEVEELGWSDIGLSYAGGPYAFRDHPYKTAEKFQIRDGEDLGVVLVFEQHLGGAHTPIWHINQDLILALNLLREDDKWVRPEEGYIDVIKEKRNDEGRVISIESALNFCVTTLQRVDFRFACPIIGSG